MGDGRGMDSFDNSGNVDLLVEGLAGRKIVKSFTNKTTINDNRVSSKKKIDGDRGKSFNCINRDFSQGFDRNDMPVNDHKKCYSTRDDTEMILKLNQGKVNDMSLSNLNDSV